MDILRALKVLFIIAVGFIAFIIIIFIALIVMSRFFSTPGRSMRNAEKDLQRNNELFDIVKDYISGSEYDYIYISSNMRLGVMSAGEQGRVLINTEEVADAIMTLRKRGFHSIVKSNSCIKFHRQAFLREISYGIVYSIDGHIPDESAFTFLTKIEPLSEDGWYYYEEDYNEFRIRNRSD